MPPFAYRDGIGPYERWRADLLASMGYAGGCFVHTSDNHDSHYCADSA